MTALDLVAASGTPTRDAGAIREILRWTTLSVHERLTALSEIACTDSYQPVTLDLYAADASLPPIEDWLYRLDGNARSHLVALLYIGGHEFTRAVLTDNGARIAEEKLAKDRLRLADLQEAKNDSYTASGDTWHDNPGFKDLEQSVDRLEKDVRRRERLLTEGLRVAAVDAVARTQVTIGSKVSYEQAPVRGQGRGVRIDAEIVGAFEQDPDEDRYSYLTPVANALRGLGVGSTRTYELPAGKFAFHVVALG